MLKNNITVWQLGQLKLLEFPICFILSSKDFIFKEECVTVIYRSLKFAISTLKIQQTEPI